MGRAADLLWANLAHSGFRLRTDGDQLMVSPANLLTADQRAAITQHRTEILAIAGNLDQRRFCGTCTHARGDWCGAHPASGLPRGYIGGITAMAQNCPVWAEAAG